MLLKYAALVAALLSSTAIASLEDRAEFIPQIFDRTTRPSGGWSLSLGTQQTCPADAPACGSTWCCPTALTCVHTGGDDTAEACCPGAIDCISAFQAAPSCADDSWSLWNATLETGNDYEYFCCLPGQVGLQDGTCVPSDQTSSPTQIAVELGAGSSGTTAPATSSASSTASSIGVSTTSSTSESTIVKTVVSTSEASVTTTTGTSAQSTSTASTKSEVSTTSSSTTSSSSAPATQSASAGKKNIVGAGVFGLAGAVGFAVGIL